MEEKLVYGGLTVYRERGAYLRRLEQFEKAKVAYDEAYKFKPDDVRLLIGRSQVCSDAVEPEQAFADAALALKLEPNNMVAKNTQARAMYTMSAFESSLVMNHRGARVRKQPPYFKEGVIQGLQTLQDCIGNNAGDVMLDLLPTIKATRHTYGADLEPEIKHVSRIPKPVVKDKLTQWEARKRDVLSRVMTMKYLGSMANDKFFFEALLEDPRLMSADVPGSQELKKLVKDALKKLNDHQNALRSQQPYHTIQKAEKSESSRLKKYKKDILMEERKVGAMHVERALTALQKCLEEKRISDLVFKAERLQIFLDSKTPRTLPQIKLYHDQLYMIKGNGYLSQYRISYKLSENSNKRRIFFLLGLPIGRDKIYDSVIANYPFKLTAVNEQIRSKKRRLELCENPYMKCSLYYELARLELNLENYMKTNFYALKCQEQAAELDSGPWWLNGCFCLMSSHIKQGNIHEFKSHILEAFHWGKRLSQEASANIQGFLMKCKAEADSYILAGERASEIKRERDILKAMDEKSKAEATLLFKRISVLPSGRRFSVLPKFQQALNMASERRKSWQRGMTIIPTKEKPIKIPQQPKLAGFQVFDIR